MDKYERGQAREYEIAITKAINEEDYSIYNVDKKAIEKISKKIKKDFPDIKKAEHLGDEVFKTVGDCILHMNDGSINYLEIKVAKSKGTLANLSGDNMERFGLFDLSWSKHREDNDFHNKVLKIMKKYGFKSEFSNKKDFEREARKIRDLSKKRDLKATQCKDEISELARENILEYLKLFIDYYNKNKKRLSPILKTFYLNMISGNTSVEKYNPSIDKKSSNYYTYYYNTETSEVYTEKDNVLSLIDKNSSFLISYKEDNEYFDIVLKTKKETYKILRCCLSWGNIFQGIKNPCIRVFRVD